MPRFAHLAALLALASSPIGGARADPVDVLFVGNSITHGRYPPALNYGAGPGQAAGRAAVHDLLCPSLPCAGKAGRALAEPTAANTPGTTLLEQLHYLQARPAARYVELGPFGGVAGIFLQLTKEAGLDYNVSLIANSGATLTAYANNTGKEAGDLPLIENPAFQHIILQDQTFDPLPPSITVNGRSVPTRGNPARFQSGVTRLVDAVGAADRAANRPLAQITLAETPPLAVYGYTSANPNQPIFGSGAPAAHRNPATSPYLGDADPMAAMASDLHRAYQAAATAYAAAHPNGNPIDVAFDGDAWVTAMNFGLAQRDPYLDREPPHQVDLWDSNPLLACCTTPVGYHPSRYGDLLNADMLFGRITGRDPSLLTAEYDPRDPHYAASASKALGIPPQVAAELAVVAEQTLVAGRAVVARPPPP